MLLLKRIFDFIVSLISFIILCPFFLVIGLAIKIDSRGPIIFKQKRLGQFGREFNILKFRTMVVNSENMGTGVRIISENDTRITKVGKFLRKTSLDELPQLINILLGQMSFVGPRPPVTYHPYKGIENYPEWIKERFVMKPGLTGMAQIKLRNSKGWDERFVLDVKYVHNFSLSLDVKILLATVSKLFGESNLYLSED